VKRVPKSRSPWKISRFEEVDVDRVTAHFLDGAMLREVDYWVIPRKDKETAYLKVHGSERACLCENGDTIRKKLGRVNAIQPSEVHAG
jgi:hypothetical protein